MGSQVPSSQRATGHKTVPGRTSGRSKKETSISGDWQWGDMPGGRRGTARGQMSMEPGLQISGVWVSSYGREGVWKQGPGGIMLEANRWEDT